VTTKLLSEATCDELWDELARRYAADRLNGESPAFTGACPTPTRGAQLILDDQASLGETFDYTWELSDKFEDALARVARS